MAIIQSKFKSIAVLTGAGISAASGLRTYRGPDGLWSDPSVARFSSKQGFIESPSECWKFWGQLRHRALNVKPNAGHLALAQWQKKLSASQTFTLITQNIDELHQRAGSLDVVELHGSIFTTRCSDDRCKFPPFRDERDPEDVVSHCPVCGAVLRPGIILFDEALPAEAEWRSKKAFRDCDLFIAVGTSGTVSPASHFVRWAKYANAKTILVNLESAGEHSEFDEQFVGRAEELLPTLLC